jgi:hypothetical protein
MTIDVTLTFGIPGSASTWVFNVVRELRMLQHDGRPVESFYSDWVAKVQQVLQDNQQMDRFLIWKLHEPDQHWRRFLSESRLPLILSLRDPRDAMLSLMERFGEAADHALDRVSVALERVIESVEFDHVALRYEDGFFERASTVRDLAVYLGVAMTDAQQARIFTAYQTASVKQFAEQIDTLPAARVRRVDTLHYDDVTQIHRRHIGNQRVGKWRDQFDADERKLLNARFRPFLDAFGYDRD